eukprot:c20183_g1_i1.p1 GENE.c20183_g1_i1~~c20183_g1_i1.p1  ORF type:complete len:971 (+),score=389.66 c20183_g1_i1:62-2974(+)
MTEWPGNKVRDTYIKFFEEKLHTFVASSPAVPLDDPTLLFTNAGMNQFKPIFLGTVDPSSPLAKLKRAANSQKCIRAGGKHNDLEDVGKDVYHHTFFEMLGNWSFGDYFKVEAIEWAWELLTKVYGINKERLYATYFGGDPKQGLEPDEEAKSIWLRFLPPNRVLPFGMKENFWEMGETGPCGPCTEIHYDRIGGRDAGHLVNMDDPDVLEIWNLVFIQFNRESETSLRRLPACHVDTGMGFERLTSVLQNKRSNYDTDVFDYIFKYIKETFGAPDYKGRVGADDDGVDTAYRVLADHVRTLTIAISDGALPSNTGRGYVLRRIVRRAARYGRQFFNTETGFLSKMVPMVADKLGEFFPEMKAKQATVVKVILEEEEQFGKTLDLGLKQFLKVVEGLKGKTIPGRDAYKLYDTFGFPLDLTQLMAAERGLTVDTKGYDDCMAQAKITSNVKAKAGENLVLAVDQTDALRRLGCPPTNDEAKYLWNQGKTIGPSLPCRVVAIWNGTEFLREAKFGEDHLIGLVLDRTTFYSEAGGQVADKGRIVAGAGSNDGQTPDGGETWQWWEVDVVDVQKFGSYVLHIGNLVSGSIPAGSEAVALVDYSYRTPVASNHTATHVLNYALRKHLEQDDVSQKGSLVDSEKLRFDFNHNGPVPLATLEKVEEEFRNIIQEAKPVFTQQVPQVAALQIRSLRAVFGETYPDNVRVVSIGRSVKDLMSNPSNEEWDKYSIEFCGGTHVEKTSAFEQFVILQEEGISKGVRRITATTQSTAQKALNSIKSLQARVNALSAIQDPATLSEEVSKLRAEMETETTLLPLLHRRKIEEQLGEYKKKAVSSDKGVSSDSLEAVEKLALAAAKKKPVFVVTEVPTGANAKNLKTALDVFEKNAPGKAVLLFGVDTAKNTFTALASVPADLSKKLSASEWIKVSVVDVCGGKGGGKADRAQGSATDASKLQDAIKAAQAHAKSHTTAGKN